MASPSTVKVFLSNVRWLGLFCLLLWFCSGCAATTGSSPSGPVTEVQTESATQKLGIEVVALRLAAGGYMLDFRYRAIEPERAVILFDRQTKPYLIHEGTGAKFLIPAPAKVGPLRQTSNQPVAGKVYFMMFANPGQYVKAGDQVTVVFGDYLIEHLTVE
jgi:hypothetical protein